MRWQQLVYIAKIRKIIYGAQKYGEETTKTTLKLFIYLKTVLKLNYIGLLTILNITIIKKLHYGYLSNTSR